MNFCSFSLFSSQTSGYGLNVEMSQLCKVKERKYDKKVIFLVIPVNKHGSSPLGRQKKTLPAGKFFLSDRLCLYTTSIAGHQPLDSPGT